MAGVAYSRIEQIQREVSRPTRPGRPGGSTRLLPSTASTAGLPPAGAIALAVVLTAVGALLDGATGVGLRSGFAVCFVAGSVAAAFLVRWSGLRPVVVAPPLVYAGVALLAGLLRGGSLPRTPVRQALELFTQLVLGAPGLITGTLLVLVIAVARVLRGR